MNTKQSIAEAFRKLKEHEEQTKSQKVDMLVSTISKTNSNENLIRRVLEAGLPKVIFLSKELYHSDILNFSFFAETRLLPDTIEGSRIIFSWESYP